MFEKIVEIGILFDFYGRLLSEKQIIAIDLYYNNDFSLSEIGEELEISRQGVHDTLKRAESRLYMYEETLGLVKKFILNKEKAKEILDCVSKINEESNLLHSDKIQNYVNDIEKFALEILESSQEGRQ